MSELYTINDDVLDLNMHSGQMKAWESAARFIGVLAGTQGGKTAFGPWWLAREIETCGHGDYLVVSSTYDLFFMKLLPTLLEVFCNVLKIGRYWATGRFIEIADPDTGEFRGKRATDINMYARIILRSAEAPKGLESSTAKAAWLDEAGMDNFTFKAWEAVLRRVSLASEHGQGRCLLTTTIYNLGWLKTEVYDRWASGDPDFEVVQFDSTENPNFPLKEFERARRTMPDWRFNMMYRGRFERPAGMIYDSFDERRQLVPRQELPLEWPRYLGLDFGGVNTAGMFYACEPHTNRYIAYREYKEGGRTAAEHARALLGDGKSLQACVGGSHSEGQWRREFQVAGLHVREPDIKSVEVGIDRVYGAHKSNQLFIFNDLAGYIREKKSYARKLDKSGLPTEEIENKSSYHYLDAERYIMGWLLRPIGAQGAIVSGQLNRRVGSTQFLINGR